jgi:hypothetical protein
MRNNETKIKHVTEHDGSKWVELDVVEEMYAMLEEYVQMVEDDRSEDFLYKFHEVAELLKKARGEL